MIYKKCSTFRQKNFYTLIRSRPCLTSLVCDGYSGSIPTSISTQMTVQASHANKAIFLKSRYGHVTPSMAMRRGD